MVNPSHTRRSPHQSKANGLSSDDHVPGRLRCKDPLAHQCSRGPHHDNRLLLNAVVYVRSALIGSTALGAAGVQSGESVVDAVMITVIPRAPNRPPYIRPPIIHTSTRQVRLNRHLIGHGTLHEQASAVFGAVGKAVGRERDVDGRQDM